MCLRGFKGMFLFSRQSILTGIFPTFCPILLIFSITILQKSQLDNPRATALDVSEHRQAKAGQLPCCHRTGHLKRSFAPGRDFQNRSGMEHWEIACLSSQTTTFIPSFAWTDLRGAQVGRRGLLTFLQCQQPRMASTGADSGPLTFTGDAPHSAGTGSPELAPKPWPSLMPPSPAARAPRPRESR